MTDAMQRWRLPGRPATADPQFFRVVAMLMLYFVFNVAVYTDVEGGSGETASRHRMGAILPLSGPAAQYGVWVREGIDLAVAHLEEDHAGHKFEVLYQDDQNAPDRSISALNKLISIDRTPVIIGAVTSSCTTAIAPLAQRKSVVLVSPSSSAPGLSEVGDYFFRVWSSDEYASRKLVSQLIGRLSPSRVGILYVNNDYGQGVLRIATREFEAAGVPVVASEGYPPNQTNFRAHMTRLKAASPDVVLLIGYASELAHAVKQASELEVGAQLVGQEGIESDLLFDVAGKAAEGIIYFVPQFDPDDPNSTIQRFVRDFKKRHDGRAPEIFAAHGYDAATVIGKAMIQSRADNSRSVRDALASTKDFVGVTGRFSFDEHGDVQKDLMAKMVKGGVFVVVRD